MPEWWSVCREALVSKTSIPYKQGDRLALTSGEAHCIDGCVRGRVAMHLEVMANGAVERMSLSEYLTREE